VSFAVAPEAYDRFMGRFSVPLAPVFADFAGVAAGQRILDVGCGPGALTAVLVDRAGAQSVAAVDPSEPFIAAVQARHPGVRAERASAEALPFEDAEFDTAVAQLVVHFMNDPVAGLREMARVTRAGGVVAACVWDHGPDGRGPLSPFWDAAREIDPSVEGEGSRAGTRRGHLAELFAEAGIRTAEAGTVAVEVRFRGFEEWWEPFLLGVGAVGSFLGRLSPDDRAALRKRCEARFPSGPFTVSAIAWAVRGERQA
jgi:ubiquinone/menaquinone biosynthesis C-methylase UbiE